MGSILASMGAFAVQRRAAPFESHPGGRQGTIEDVPAHRPGRGTAMTEHADFIVIGMGPGGEYLAGGLAKAGHDVIAVEHRLVGGECPYYGCIPSKMMLRGAHALAEGRRVNQLAGSAELHPDLSPVAERIRSE